MKQLKLLIASLGVLLVAALLPVFVAYADNNLIQNPSVEAVTNSQPDTWTANRWGNNEATVTVANEGHTGSKSLRVDMTTRTDGDAKWMADPVNVSPNTSYTYTSYYKSNIPTEITLQYADANGNFSYVFVQSVPASADWKAVEVKFTTPAAVSKVVVMHLVAAPGWLQTDDFTLAPTVVAPQPEQPPVSNANLILNPAFETAKGSTPANWTSNRSGLNTTKFTYETTGRTGRAVTTKITGYINGEASWRPAAVTVQPGKNYVYRDYYKSNVQSRVMVAHTDTKGKVTYSELPKAAASTSWKQYEATFTIPATTTKVAVYHMLSRTGTLTVDDTLLQDATPTPPPATSITIPNASFETASIAATPDNWQHNTWGTNTANFEYMNEGHTGTKSAKVTISNYTDGDAKWFFDPITSLTPGKQYRFNAWYKTNIQPKVVMMYLTADGAEHFFGMPNPEPAANSATAWQRYSDTFIVPNGAVSVSAFMFIDQNGWLQTDDYSLTDYSPTGFTRGLLTLTFDDGEEDNVTTQLPLLKQYGFRTTNCFATTFIEGNQAAVNNIKQYMADGHEICSHTVTHPFMTTLNQADLTYELQHAQQYLKSITGAKVDNFASPYGDYNAAVNTEIKKYYRSHRTVDEGYNTKDNFNIYRLRVQNILNTTTAAQVKEWVEQAKADKTWLILVYHRIADDPDVYDTTIANFTQHLEAMKQSGITIKTTNDALNEITPQL